MGLLNYTTKIDPDKTAAEIARCLSMHGASAVMTQYDKPGGFVSALSFQIELNGRTLSFRLPCNPEPVFEILAKDSKIKRFHARYEAVQSELRLQAVRTAWRIVKDWVEAQMALVETQMVTTRDVFLPYAVMKDGQTLAQHVETNPAFLLGDGN